MASSATDERAGRSFRRTIRASSPASAASDREIPEKPLDMAMADGSVIGFLMTWTTPISRPSSASRSAMPATCDRLHAAARRGRDSCRPGCKTAGFPRTSTSSRRQRQPDGDFPNVPDHVANPEYPRDARRRPSPRPARGPDLVIASDPDADRIGVAVPVAGTPAAIGRLSTATRSASCSRRS